MTINKNINDITVADLDALINNAIAENKSIEFKRDLPGGRDDDKKEFLADVSALANSAGGFIFYGIKDEEGVAVELCGLKNIDADAEIRRLENSLLSNIEPRIPGFSTRNIPLPSGGSVIIIYIPQSWGQPHVVNFKKHWRFYARNSAGKYPLDISEVRAAFNLSESVAERIRLFRTERLSKIISGETPMSLAGVASVVLHIVPLSSFNVAATVFDITTHAHEWLKPISVGGWNHRYNFDGYLTYAPSTSEEKTTRSYLQVFRNGTFEGVNTSLLREQSIIISAFEHDLSKALKEYLKYQKRMGVSPPVLVMLSLLRVSGYTLIPSSSLQLSWDERYPIDRDTVLIPEIMIEDFDCDCFAVMKPAFDAVWNAAGWPRSMNYDLKGKWSLE